MKNGPTRNTKLNELLKTLGIDTNIFMRLSEITTNYWLLIHTKSKEHIGS